MRMALAALILCSCCGSVAGSAYREEEDRALTTKSIVSGQVHMCNPYCAEYK